jgi:uncharacterized membrane-anchored protein
MVSPERPAAGTSTAPFRALDPRPAFWVAMFMASAFGANLGDYGAGLEARTTSFAVMLAVCLVAIVVDRRESARTEACYWLAIIALRAAATNAADVLTHDLGLGYGMAALVLGLLTVGAGVLTRTPARAAGSPLIDARYWVAMALAGLFGTVAGDLMSHTTGLFVASAALTALLVVLLVLRARRFPLVLTAYWVVVLAERSAATPVADLLDSRRGAALGLPLAMVITLSAFLLALWVRRQRVIVSRR